MSPSAFIYIGFYVHVRIHHKGLFQTNHQNFKQTYQNCCVWKALEKEVWKPNLDCAKFGDV